MRPIDTTFLDRQTFGDRALRDDVLRLFVTQAQQLADGLLGSRAEGEHDVAIDLHRLKGSARAIGAVTLGQEIEAVERVLTERAETNVSLDAPTRAACAALAQEILRSCAQARELLGSA